jgi:thymidylate synthase (FAD)
MNREELLAKHGQPVQVLDHGHVRLVDVMGDDERVEQVARLSYQQGTRKVSETRSLLRYLIRHRHTSPLEQAVITLDMKMPIFVARQLVRHRTQSINELSGRYSEMPEEFYVPDEFYSQSTTNKQGRGEELDPRVSVYSRQDARQCAENAFDAYREMRARNVARETARMVLPLSTYTQWCTTMNLHNLLHMLELRLDHHAQWECRMYANAIALIVADWCPLIWEAFIDYRLDACTFSREEVKYIRERIAMDGLDLPNDDDLTAKTNLSYRERGEFLLKLGVI